jgi:predicted RNA-binding protein YlxR (DUF448 family)
LADDSGICVDALNGEPGIYSARYGFDDSLDDWGRLLLLLKNTEHVPDGQRQAQFVCVITMVTPEGEVILDLSGKSSGRGAYICKDAECLRRARKNRRISSNLKCEIPDAVWDAMEQELLQYDEAAE